VTGAVLACTETASDPRVGGTSTIVLDSRVFDETTPSAGVGWGDYALEGPEGTWTGRQYAIGEASGAQRTTTVAVGDGAYAGWVYARSATHAVDGTVDIVGTVYQGDPPPEFPVTALTGLLPGDDPGPLPPAEEASPAMTGTLELGKGEVKATKATVGAAGGTVAMTKRGDPIAGLTITIPPGAFAADTRIRVASQAITGLGSATDYSGALTPLTALYTVETGGATLATPATVELSYTLPADAPTSAVPMAFYHDPDSGMLSPLTTVGADATHLVAVAPHFSSIFAGLLDLAKIPTIVDSRFRPGTDDWQFPNVGSYIAPGGHCEGQVLSELWYYVNRRRAEGASPLHGLYDNNGAARTPRLWQDDSDGYRLASVVQREPYSEPNVADFLGGYDPAARAFSKTPPDTQTYDLFRAAIALTGQPQEIGIAPADGKGGHAMLVYMVTPQWLLIADPNYPGVSRRIRYDPVAGRLGPFISGNNAADIAAGNNTVYTRFALIPSQVVSANTTMAAFWSEFEAGTIGDGVFPGYTLEASEEVDGDGNPVWVPLTDGMTTDKAKIAIRAGELTDGYGGAVRVFRGDAELTPGRTYNWQVVDLTSGENQLGVLVVGTVSGTWEYVDFVRVTVNSGPAPSPSPIQALNEPLEARITADAVINPETLATCQADVWILFYRLGGGPDERQGRVVMSATCIDGGQSAIDATGTFDGTTFRLEDGSSTWSGTFDGATATLTGGPGGITFVFPVR
jgi:hypothetical protein